MLNTPPVNLPRIGIPPEVAGLISKELAKTYCVLPVSRLEAKLFLAMADPLNVLAIDEVRRITKLEVSPLIAPEKAILDKLNNLDAGRNASMEEVIKAAEKQAELEAEAEGAELIAEQNENLSADQLAAAGEKPPSSSSPTSSSSRPSRTAPATFTSSPSRKWCACATAWTVC